MKDIYRFYLNLAIAISHSCCMYLHTFPCQRYMDSSTCSIIIVEGFERFIAQASFKTKIIFSLFIIFQQNLVYWRPQWEKKTASTLFNYCILLKYLWELHKLFNRSGPSSTQVAANNQICCNNRFEARNRWHEIQMVPLCSSNRVHDTDCSKFQR